MKLLQLLLVVAILLPACNHPTSRPASPQPPLPPSMTHAIGSPCSLPGQAVQWIGDYCLFREQTDDLVAAGGCIAEEQGRTTGMEECRVASRYKSELCKLHLSAGIRPGTLAECVNDAGFSGNIVRNNGSR